MHSTPSTSPSPQPYQDQIAQLEARVKDLEAALGQNDCTIASTFRLPPKLSDLLGLLLNLTCVTNEIIEQRLGIASDAKVTVHRLRQALEPWGIKIQMRRRYGYWLDDVTKERIRSMVTQGVTKPSVSEIADGDELPSATILPFTAPTT